MTCAFSGGGGVLCSTPLDALVSMLSPQLQASSSHTSEGNAASDSLICRRCIEDESSTDSQIGAWPGAWGAGEAIADEWLQVTFVSPVTVSEVETQGRQGGPTWGIVDGFRFEWSLEESGDTFFPAMVGGSPLITTSSNNFNGVSHQTVLDAPVTGVRFRFYVETWANYPSMRMELWGCIAPHLPPPPIVQPPISCSGNGCCLCPDGSFVGTAVPPGWGSCQTILDFYNICGDPDTWSKDRAKQYCCVGTSSTINGITCPQSQVIVVDNNCVSGSPHFDPEGSVCANDGLETEAYCSYDVGPSACARCGSASTATPPPCQPDDGAWNGGYEGSQKMFVRKSIVCVLCMYTDICCIHVHTHTHTHTHTQVQVARIIFLVQSTTCFVPVCLCAYMCAYVYIIHIVCACEFIYVCA